MLEQANLYNRFDLNQSFSDNNLEIPSPNRDQVVHMPGYVCPSDPKTSSYPFYLSYLGIQGSRVDPAIENYCAGSGRVNMRREHFMPTPPLECET